MNSAIIFYSYSGHTKKIAGFLSEYLRPKGEVEIIELKALYESDRFFNQAVRAFRHKRARLEPVNFDLRKFDLICFGSPVWAFAPAPAVNSYLDKCFGVEAKEVILFSTYGSGTGNQRCLNYMQGILNKKGAKSFRRFSIQQFKVNDAEFIKNALRESRI